MSTPSPGSVVGEMGQGVGVVAVVIRTTVVGTGTAFVTVTSLVIVEVAVI